MVKEYRHFDGGLIHKPYEIYDELFLPDTKVAWIVEPNEREVAHLRVIWKGGIFFQENINRMNLYARLSKRNFFDCVDFFNPNVRLDEYIPADKTHRVRRLKFIGNEGTSYLTFKNVHGVLFYFKNNSNMVPKLNHTYISSVIKNDDRNNFWKPMYDINDSKIFEYCYDIWDFGDIKGYKYI